MSLSEQDWTAFSLTLKLAGASTGVLLLLGLPLAWWLSQTRWKYKFVVEAAVALPLVLPPTVLGFYLLVAFGPDGPIGRLTSFLGLPSLAFSFPGLLVGSVFYSLPFVVQPVQNAFAAIGRQTLEEAAMLGASAGDRFFTIVLPLARSGILTAAILGFAHTLGEFGVVLMIGGNIPGSTQVLSIAIYDHVEALDYERAHLLSALLLLSSFLLMLTVYAINRRFSVLQEP